MPWLSDGLKDFIAENPNQSAYWYTKKYGCSITTTRKVMVELGLYTPREKKTKKQIHDAKRSKDAWMKQLGQIIKRNERVSNDWESWLDWCEMLNSGLTPWDAYLKSKGY